MTLSRPGMLVYFNIFILMQHFNFQSSGYTCHREKLLRHYTKDWVYELSQKLRAEKTFQRFLSVVLRSEVFDCVDISV